MIDLAYEPVASMGRERRDEGLAFQRLAAMMEAVATRPADHPETVRAAHLARRVWTVLIADLSSAENALAPKTRAATISIGLSMIRDAERLLAGERDAAANIAEISHGFAATLLGEVAKEAA